MANEQIVIVGAGIAGLTAGYFLKQAGYHPIVLEKSGRVGGRMITDVVNGFTIDCGAQFLMDSYPILTSLIASNGLEADFIQTSQYLGTVKNGTIRKYTRSNPLSVVQHGLLTVPGWFRFILRSLPLMAKTNSQPFNDLTAWLSFEDGDAETWSTSYFGQEVTDYIVGPIFDGLFFQPLKDMSKGFVISILSGFLYRKVKNMTSLKGGIAMLPERLASQLDVRLNTPVLSIATGQTGVELQTSAGPITADRVILATTASTSNTLYPDPRMVERQLLATPYSSSLVIAIALKSSFRTKRTINDIYGVMVPKRERSVIASIGNEAFKNKFRKNDEDMLVIFLSGEAGKEMIDWEEENLLGVVLKEMEKYFAGITENILFTKIYRWKEAMPFTPTGRGRSIAQYRENIDSSTKILLAGDYMGMPFTEGAAETGKWAAGALIKNLS